MGFELRELANKIKDDPSNYRWSSFILLKITGL